MKPEGLWAQVGNKCLSCALALLESETVPAAGTAETVRILVETAVSIDSLNLRWTQQTQSCAAVFRGQPFPRQEAKN